VRCASDGLPGVDRIEPVTLPHVGRDDFHGPMLIAAQAVGNSDNPVIHPGRTPRLVRGLEGIRASSGPAPILLAPREGGGHHVCEVGEFERLGDELEGPQRSGLLREGLV